MKYPRSNHSRSLAGAVSAFGSLDDDQTFEILPLLVGDGKCGLPELASIGSASKLMHSMVLQLLCGQSYQQTTAIITAEISKVAYAATASTQEKPGHSVWWLLDAVLAPDTTAELLAYPSLVKALQHFPDMPLHLAEGLCRRGLCMRYNDIAAAACGSDRVAGVEVWVHAQQGQLGNAAGIPAAAQQLLCVGVPPIPGILPEADMVKLIQLGMNSSSTATAAAVISVLPQLPNLPAGAVAELLQTAIARHPAYNALQHFASACVHGWSPQQLTVEQLVAVMQQTIATTAEASVGVGATFAHWFNLTTGITDTSQMTAEAVAALLHTAIVAGSPDSCYGWLARRPAFLQISSEQLVGLIKAALQPSEATKSNSIACLSLAPAFEQLTPTVVASMLMDAAKAAAAAAAAAAEQGVTGRARTPGLLMLCSSVIQRANTTAGRVSAAVMQWLLPAMTVAMQAGMIKEAQYMVAGVANSVDGAAIAFTTDEALQLLQSALNLDPSGKVLKCIRALLPAAGTLNAAYLQQLCSATASFCRDAQLMLSAIDAEAGLWQH